MPSKCETNGCKHNPAYNFKGQKKRRFCKQCSKGYKGMVNVKNKRCIGVECDKIPYFNVKGSKTGIYCKQCSVITGNGHMINVKAKTCIGRNSVECTTVPVFNVRGSKIGIYCFEHHDPKTMVNVKDALCQAYGCCTRPVFNYRGEKKGIYCLKDMKVNMINVVNKKECAHSKCNVKCPIYNYEEHKTGLYCKKHKLPNMKDVVSVTCSHPDCKLSPNYNFYGQTKRLYCNEHKKENMVNVTTGYCEFPGCTIQPSYNYYGSTKRLYCNEHKKEYMIDVLNKRCEMQGCELQSSFDYKGKPKTGRFCSEHKSPKMVNVKAGECQENGCNKIPSFNHEGSKERLYCSEHKKKDMIDIVHDKCNEDGCTTTPKFNFRGEKSRLYCVFHKRQGMVDISYKECKECTNRVYYGIPGNNASVCSDHKKPGMLPNPNSKCIEQHCNEMALYGIQKQLHCEDHKTKDEEDLVRRECVSCGLVDILDHNKKCVLCDPTFFKKFRLAKQKKVSAFLKLNNKNEFIEDRTNDTRCGAERPDFKFDLGHKVIVLECDEDQHKSRLSECEQDRMINLSQSFGCQTIFLRYNPDEYKTNGELFHQDDSSRLEVMNRWLNYLIELDITKPEFLSVVYLYYNEYECDNVCIRTILPYEKEQTNR